MSPVAAILIIEDDADNRQMLASVVAIMGYDILAAESGEQALRMLAQRTDVALVVSDIRLPGMDGLSFGEVMRKRHPSIKVAYVTGDDAAAEEAIQKGAVAMLKPYDFSVLTRVIVEALGHQSP